MCTCCKRTSQNDYAFCHPSSTRCIYLVAHAQTLARLTLCRSASSSSSLRLRSA
eukprot:Nitzschia sp. Nitz4//scaffold32_size149145//143459//143617//NITZ4_002904-RA/size149145-exonerate_est2genome-gene-0.80-mRNA-1//-1//CDS//3329548144//2017//frame0